jgi:light-regulated signal transduction histidine kinase (bacteriophytochrome)
MVTEADPVLELDGCAREPIHIIGHIQSRGLLFALSEPDLIVQRVSANVEALLSTSPQAVLGRSLEDLLGARQFIEFRTHIAVTGDLATANPLRMLVGSAELEMNCIAHRQDGVLIAEFELVRGARSLEPPLNLAAHIQIPFSQMQQASDVFDLCRVASREIYKLTGFDRVMVYRFDAEWNGEVIAETARPSPVSYLGLRFPASDIPPQARRLFLENRLRTIADAGSAPVPIVPEIDPSTGEALDLTRSFLRSASPIHIQYLHNMNVVSSMTVSIIVQGRLWGMIACHDAAPRPVDCSVRAVCELIGGILASQVEWRIDKAALESRLASRKMLESYMAGMEASTVLFEAEPFESPWLLALLDADGLIARIDDVLSFRGVVLAEEALLPIIARLRTFASRGIASSSTLSTLDASAEAYASRASGALYMGLAEGSGDYLLLLRAELVETVTWAGNPDKGASTDVHGALRPRTSFAAWKETVRGHSRPWTELEQENARFVREQMLRLQTADMLRKSEQRVQTFLRR